MHTGADFISLRGEESRTSKPRRGLTSSRGHYGPPKGPVTRPVNGQDPVPRTKRKREATLDRVRNEHLIRMPWHGSDPYLDGIVGWENTEPQTKRSAPCTIKSLLSLDCMKKLRIFITTWYRQCKSTRPDYKSSIGYENPYWPYTRPPG